MVYGVYDGRKIYGHLEERSALFRASSASWALGRSVMMYGKLLKGETGSAVPWVMLPLSGETVAGRCAQVTHCNFSGQPCVAGS